MVLLFNHSVYRARSGRKDRVCRRHRPPGHRSPGHRPQDTGVRL